jgi:nicotinate-nucleotide adenylyltransferase
MQRKVGILGGSFDPIHFGHLNLAISLMEACSLDEVLVIPTSLSPFKEGKPPLASAEHRLAMLKLVLAPLRAFRLIDSELHAKGPSYTIDTVRKLSQDPSMQLHLLIGEDHLASLHRWKEAEELLRLSPPLVGAREVGEASRQKNVYRIPIFEISSTNVRKRLSEKKYCGHLVPAPALDYIQKHKLYL